MATTIDLSLAGCANGAPADMAAQVVLGGGVLELNVTATKVPLHWDPVLGLLACSTLPWSLRSLGRPDSVECVRQATVHRAHT